MRTVCGKLKSDYRYAASIVYNNFPWPENPAEKQTADIETKAQAVLDARAQFPDSTLANLYDPLTMPPPLQKAHAIPGQSRRPRLPQNRLQQRSRARRVFV